MWDPQGLEGVGTLITKVAPLVAGKTPAGFAARALMYGGAALGIKCLDDKLKEPYHRGDVPDSQVREFGAQNPDATFGDFLNSLPEHPTVDPSAPDKNPQAKVQEGTYEMIPLGANREDLDQFDEDKKSGDLNAQEKLNQRVQDRLSGNKPNTNTNPSESSKEGGTTVYVGDDGYIGITNDFDRRAKEWARQGRNIAPLYKDLDRETARGVEQELIEQGRKNGNEANKDQNNSIDPNRKDDKANRMRQKGKDFLEQQKAKKDKDKTN